MSMVRAGRFPVIGALAALAFLPALAGGRAWPALGPSSSPGANSAEGPAPAPLIPRSEMLTVDELRPGMKGVGKTVFQGTKIESFGVTVVGVLRRVDFDGDIILVRITSGPPVTKGLGIVAGMSGSPIYVNGKIIGALAYAWTFTKAPVAGVTPIAQMLEAYQPGSSPVRRQGTLRAPEPFLLDGERIERAVVVAPASGRGGARQGAGAPRGHPTPALHSAGAMELVPIATPVLVSGLGPRVIEDLRSVLAPLGLTPMAGAGAAGHVEAQMAPGQAVGARLIGGDLDVTAVGTVTYVKGETVLAFGHPMAGLGATDLPLVAAYVHGVVPALDISFKLASGGQTIGHFTEDRPWCIGGRLREQPDLIETSLSITDRDRGVARGYRVEVIRDRSLTSMLLVAALGGAIQSLGPPAEGTTHARLVVEAKGLPRLERENTYTVEGGGGILALLLGAFGGSESAEGELSQILEVLRNSEFGEARVGRVGVEVEFTKVRRYARIEDAYVASPRVRAGDSVPVAVTIRTSDGGLVNRTETIQVPADCPPGRVRVGVAGGRSAERSRGRLQIAEPRPVSLGQMVQQMLGRPANDELVIDLALPTVGIEARGFAFRDLPPAAIELLRAATANRPRALRDYTEQRSKTEWVVSGSVVLTLTVEGDEKDKAGQPASPQYEPPRYEQISGGFADLFFGSGYESTAAGAGLLGEGGAEVDMESPPEMPSWEEVESVGEMEAPELSAAEERKPAAAGRGEAVGRLASVWRLTDPKELGEGKAEGVALLSTGGIALAPRPQQLAQIEARCLWPVAVAPDGSVYTGTWSDGRLRKTAPDGTTTVVLETESAGIQAVAADGKGTIYAAAVPGGAIYRLLPAGRPEKLCELGVQNVWALAVTGDGSLWAATGPGGKVFHITGDGRASAAFTAADRHVTCLAVGAGDTVYFGTSPLGKVYAVSPDAPVRALGELDRAAVQSIAVDANGAIYVGTSPDGRVFRVNPRGAMEEVLKVKARHIFGLLAQPDGTVLAAAGPEGRLVAIYPDRRSALVYDSKGTYLAALTGDAGGDVYVTVADAGRLVKLDCGGAAGQGSGQARAGSYTSPAHDGGASTRWGAVRWSGAVPGGAEVAMYTRTGATSRPDRTWSEWEQVALAAGSAVPSPAGRFLQCRVDLKARGREAPQVEALEVSYLPANRAPEVTLTSPAGGEIWAGKQTVRWRGRDPDGDKLDYEVYWSSDRGKTWTKIEAPKEEAEESKKEVESGGPSAGAAGQAPSSAEGREGAAGGGAGIGAPAVQRRPGKPVAEAVPLQDDAADLEAEIMRALEAGSSDEGGEEMAEPAGEGEEAPARPPAGGSRGTSLKWDTAKVADGRYWLKAVGSDGRANPGDPQTGEAISLLFTVDNTPPELIVDRGRKEGEAPPAAITVFDGTSYIASAEFRVEAGEWLAAMAQDGVFDGQYEGVVLDPARLPEGSHEVEVRARDAAGNVASETLRYQK